MVKRIIIITVSIGLVLLLLYFTFYYPKRNEKRSVVGSYESLAPTLIEKAKFAVMGIECFYSGRKLELLPDSTFALIDSNNVLTGKWHQQAGLVELHFLSNKYANDSLLNKFGKPKVPLKDFVLKRSSPDLFGFSSDSNEKCAEIFKIKF